jgi:hypothetical protein
LTLNEMDNSNLDQADAGTIPETLYAAIGQWRCERGCHVSPIS